MNYLLSVHGAEFVIDEEEKRGLDKAIRSGSEFYYLKDGTIVTTKIGYCRPKPNKILTDPMYIRYSEICNKDGDRDVREKMRLESNLNAKYPYRHYAEEWDEAMSTSITAVVLVGGDTGAIPTQRDKKY